MDSRPLASALLATMLLASAGCTAPCGGREPSPAEVFIKFDSGANETLLEEHFRAGGWNVTPSSNAFLAHKRWNDTVSLNAVVAGGPESAAVSLHDPAHPVLTAAEARDHLAPAAEAIAADLAGLLRGTPSFAYEGGTQHCGAV